MRVPVPPDVGIVGASAFVQVVTADPGGNALGLLTSNAAELKVGWR